MTVDPSQTTLELLRDYESRNVTFLDPDGTWPIVWERAKGCSVWDAAGRRYLDLTAAFGVAAAGHANPRVVRAGQEQMERLLHAMGDVHPHALKAHLARELSRLTFERWAPRGAGLKPAAGKQPRTPCRLEIGDTADWKSVALRERKPGGSTPTGKTLFCNSGFEAVEAALKTAHLATGRAGVLAFEGAYHGLGYGALTTTHRPLFRSPFRRQLREFARFVPFPTSRRELAQSRAAVEAALGNGRIGTMLVEPIQARGGIRVPPAGFLKMLRRACDEHGALLVLDEIYTGFGRTGHWFACEQECVTPDLICLGKALTGGFPLSACVGRADLMDAAWPPSDGEALHTSTFLGHPVGCAMALAQLREIDRLGLGERALTRGAELLELLEQLKAPRGLRLETRGRGLMIGLEIRRRAGGAAADIAIAVVKQMLQRGFILLPEGADGNVIGFTPPLTISASQLARTVRVLGAVLAAEAGA
jgi:4-aminobutyrate aminotransferase-like enzyme